MGALRVQALAGPRCQASTDLVTVLPRRGMPTMQTLQVEDRLWASWPTSRNRDLSETDVRPIARPVRLAPFAQSTRPLLP
jgi:hypothetical protein